MLLLVTSIKLVAEIALCALAGQWLLGVLAGPRRADNLVYQLLSTLTRPFVTAVRAVAPARWRARPLLGATFLLLLCLWTAALAAKVALCRVGPGVLACP